MASGRRFLGNQVRLSRRAWEDVAPELEFMLQRLWESEANGIPAGFNNIVPETIEAGVAGDPGLENSGWAAADHVHPVSTAAATNLANANSEGVASSLARSDHKHKRDVRVKLEGADVATRNALDLRDSSSVDVAVSDDPGNDEVDLTFSAKPWLNTTNVSTTPYAVLATDFVLLVDATVGDITINLPAANLTKRWLEVKKVDAGANKVIIDAAGADLIDGDATQELLFEDEALPIVSNGVSEWSVL